MDFGSWKSGIVDATHHAFINLAESGLFVYVMPDTLYQGVKPKERENVEYTVLIHREKTKVNADILFMAILLFYIHI